MARLEKWFVSKVTDNPYQSPEQGTKYLVGIIYGRECCTDGRIATTSRIVFLDTAKKVARTQNTEYELGEIDPKWLEWINEQGYALEQFDIK